jgi:hypothetical protein
MGHLVTWLALDRTARGLILYRGVDYVQIDYGSIKPRIHWNPWPMPSGRKRTAKNLTTHLCLMPSFGTFGELHPRPQHTFMGWCIGTVVTRSYEHDYDPVHLNIF